MRPPKEPILARDRQEQFATNSQDLSIAIRCIDRKRRECKRTLLTEKIRVYLQSKDNEWEKTTLIIESITIAIYYLYMYVTIIFMNGNLTLAWTSEIFYWFVLLIISWSYFYLFDWKKRIKYY